MIFDLIEPYQCGKRPPICTRNGKQEEIKLRKETFLLYGDEIRFFEGGPKYALLNLVILSADLRKVGSE
jgi:hypothetical protein